MNHFTHRPSGRSPNPNRARYLHGSVSVVTSTAASASTRVDSRNSVAPTPSLSLVIEIGSRRRTQPAPPHILFDVLFDPDGNSWRRWLELRRDEVRPTVLRAEKPATLAWSSLWPWRPDAVIEFDLQDRGGGTDLRWTLYVDAPSPDDAEIGHMRKRLNQLINADLRFSFGQ
jgi:hypothetical protein